MSLDVEGGILPLVMVSRCRTCLPALLWLLLLVPSTASAQDEDATPAPSTRPAVASVEGRQVPVSVARTYRGPLVSIAPLVRVLGGRLETGLGAGRTLEVEGARFAFGPDSDALIRDEEIVTLSQNPAVSSDGLLVPLDLLEAVYGELQGFRFGWDPAAQVLTVERPVMGEIAVTADVVHLQGVSTVVLRLPERPLYRIEERSGGVDVELRGVTVAPADRGLQRPDDPLVRSVDVGTSRIRIDLASDASASSYTLDGPFRLVFDVHRARRASGPDADADQETPERPRRATPHQGIRTIVIDPGHGGAEVGAVGPSGAEEKDLTLSLARALKSRLESRLPVKVVLTRTEDAHLPLDTRTAVANQNKADLFLSIHLNAEAGTSARGAETYFLSLQASDARAAESAEAENQVATGGGDGDPLYDLQLILWDLAQSHHLSESQAVARLIQEELNGALGLRDRGVKQAPFRVLMGAAMPAVLVELGFLSNPEEEDRLLDPSYRSELVSALVRAVSRYRAQVESRETTSTATTSADGETPATPATGDGDR